MFNTSSLSANQHFLSTKKVESTVKSEIPLCLTIQESPWLRKRIKANVVQESSSPMLTEAKVQEWKTVVHNQATKSIKSCQSINQSNHVKLKKKKITKVFNEGTVQFLWW